MGILYLPWTSQPQQAIDIDWGNPITRGLVTAIVPIGGKHRDIAKKSTTFSYTGTHIHSVASGGVGVRNNTITAANKVVIDLKTETVGSITICYALCVHQIGGTTYPFFRNNQTQILASGTAGPTWGFRAGVATNVFSSTPIKLNQFTSVAFAQSGTTAQLAVDGLLAYEDYSGGSSALISTSAIDANTSFAQSNDFTLYQCLIWDRGLSKAELKRLTANPWQIFKPLPRRIFVPVAAGGDPTLYPSLYSNTSSFYAPTVSVGAVTLTPSLFSNSNTFHSATVTLGGATQTLTTSLYSNTNTFHAPSVSPGAVTLTPSLVTNTNSFFGAVVTLDSDKILYPSLVSNSNSFYGPTVSVGAVSLLPSLFVNSNTFYSHVVGGALTDSEKIDLILDILSNRQTLDATTGIYTLYADDGVTVLKTAQAWEDSEGTQPYRGRGLKRLDALQ